VAKTQPAEFQATYETLRAVFKPYERHFVVLVDEPGKYYLSYKTSKHASGAIWFGGAEIKKNYVTFHFIPIYMAPALVKTLPPLLLKRMQGKGCFNFTEIEPAHVKALKALTKKGYDVFIKKFQ
jgi:hypothetical protein